MLGETPDHARASSSIEDDDELELPRLTGDDDDRGPELSFLEDDVPEGEETVGLDVDAGFAEADDLLLEELSFTGDGEVSAPGEDEDELFADAEDEGSGEEETGWAEGAAESEAAGWDADLAWPAELSDPVADSGEEGVEERYEIATEEEAHRSVLSQAGEDVTADDLELPEADIASPVSDFEVEHPALTLLRNSTAQAIWLGPGEMITAVRGSAAAGIRVHRLHDDTSTAIGIDPLEGEVASSIAELPDGLFIVGTTSGRAFRMESGGKFVVSPGLEGAEARPFYVTSDRAGRLWGRIRGGALVRSDDGGGRWSRPVMPRAVLAWTRAGEGLWVVAGSRQGALSALRTSDGSSWKSIGLPKLDNVPDDAELVIAAEGATFLLSADTPGRPPWLSEDEGATFRTVPSLRDLCVAEMSRERGRVVLYAAIFVEAIDRGWVVRATEGAFDRPEVILDLNDFQIDVSSAAQGEAEQRIADLDVRRGVDHTIVLVATAMGVIRVTIPDREGEPHV